MSEQHARSILEERAVPLPLRRGSCPYLPRRRMVLEHWLLPDVSYSEHRRLLDANFRRSGIHFFRPRCPDCSLCRQLRIRVRSFRPSRSQRRVLRRNRDLTVVESVPYVDDERADLYRRYIEGRHPDSPQGSSPEDLEQIFDGWEGCGGLVFETRDPSGRLLAVSFAYRVARGLSSVYCFFAPEEPRRSLGTFSVLWEIDWCRRRGLSFYYLGYWIRGCRTMDYKSRFRPHEVYIPWRGRFESVR